MNGGSAHAAALQPVRWKLRHWIYAVAAAFALQVGLLYFLGQRSQPSLLPRPFGAAIHLAADAWSEEQLAKWPLLRDPTLFALPHARGFSGSAWLTVAPPPDRLMEWSEPSPWLGLDLDELGATFSKFVSTNLTPPLLIADKPTPRLTGLDPIVPNVPMAAQTKLRLEGELAQRRLLTPLTPPSWAHPNVLSNTVVQMLVDAEGHTVSTTLLMASGLPDADQLALTNAAGARFNPLRRPQGGPDVAGRLMWGKLVFQWHVVPPQATNATIQ